ncbi:SDR family NAD(P)-dependent oxidoreductase [Kribbella qitaiheensis]|uniref:SDR family NAD(P)-dependent oxidoreductase n=1 Tax=Kribbella qitaiheensis TaxID=1544730 RepID=A0A7G6X3Y5_9ACTN|nr:SDR family NAD(P)-dependent oxidoreductase [Kribbella qitaiheensis]QNE20950.1 SDR family NAD(P)-dependent oxidoreductase [Kribbella qitaiheensis]
MRRIAVVTGANQGIGFALVEGLAARMNPEDLILLTSRNSARVAEAADRVKGVAQVEGRVLDVSDAAAVAELAADLQAQYGGVDIVISNAVAPLSPDRSQAEQADQFIAVANGGTQSVLRSFGPVLRPGGRLIVVASSLGTLDQLDPKLHPLFDGPSFEQIEQTVEEWRLAIHAGTAADEGWPEWVNTPSKVGQVAAVRAVAARRREADLPQNTLIASVCPGLVDTRASRPWFDDFSQARTPEQAAVPILDLVLADRVDPATYGELVRDGAVLPWRGNQSSEEKALA